MLLVVAAAAAALCSDPSDFGGTPNDTISDEAALQAAIDHATVNSREVCIPSGTWLLAKPPGKRASLAITGNRLKVYGTGAATVLAMTGDGGKGDWYGIDIRSASRIEFSDFSMTATTTFNTEEQTHLVQVGPGSSAVKLHHLLLGPMRKSDAAIGTGAGGDCVRLLGEIPTPVDGVEIVHSRFVDCDRSGISLQRAVRRVTIEHVDIIGTGDAPIDFEPTAPGPIDTIMMRDLFIDQPKGSQSSACIAIAGRGSDTARRVTVRDSILQGGGVSMLNVDQVTLENNDIASGDGVASTILLRRRATNVKIIGNAIYRRSNSTSAPVISVQHNNGIAPRSIVIKGNFIRQETGAAVLEVLSARQIRIERNVVQYAGESSATPVVFARSVIDDVSDLVVVGNDIRGKANALLWLTAGDRKFGKLEMSDNRGDDLAATVGCDAGDRSRSTKITIRKNRVGNAVRTCL